MTTQEYTDCQVFYKLEDKPDESDFEPLYSSGIPRVGDDIKFWRGRDADGKLQNEEFIVTKVRWNHVVDKTAGRRFIHMECIVSLKEKKPDGPPLQELYDFVNWELELEKASTMLLGSCCEEYVWRLRRGDVRDEDTDAFRDMHKVEHFAETLINGRPGPQVKHLKKYLEEYRTVDAKCPVEDE